MKCDRQLTFASKGVKPLKNIDDHAGLVDREFKKLLARIKELHLDVDSALVERGFAFACKAHEQQYRKSGIPYVTHCIEVAQILAEHFLKTPSIVAALLHDTVEDTSVTITQIRDEFGAEISDLVEGLTKISRLHFQNRAEFQVENFRKMILAMAEDVRVILIKLADRLTNMRTLEYLAEDAVMRIAVETRDIYVPLAHRFGLYRIKTELEDLCFKFLRAEEFNNLLKEISCREDYTQKVIDDMRDPIQDALKESSILGRICGRLKSMHSIQHKMQRDTISFNELHDLLALRIITRDQQDCYRIIGLVHGLYTPIQGRFKDYIATPKANMYQSLHTAVMSPSGGQMVEVQVRTEEMHRVAEMGIAAHWRYKEGRESIDELDRHVEWLRGMVDWQHDIKNPDDFMKIFKIDLYHDEVFIFTPQGEPVRLPLGATPIDFAFDIHTDIGLSCISAKVNKEVVPLDYLLRNGDTVEIILSSESKPAPEWIEFVKTSKARSRLERWFRHEQFEHSRDLGQEIFEKNFEGHINAEELLNLAQSFGNHDADHLYAAVGRGDIHIQELLNKLNGKRKCSSLPGIRKILDTVVLRRRGVRVQGDANSMIELSDCCQPVPGDHIIAFRAEKGKGLVVHRTECPEIVTLLDDLDLRVEVDWDISNKDQFFTSTLVVVGSDRQNLLINIIDSFSKAGITIKNAHVNTSRGMAHNEFVLKVKNIQQVHKVLKSLRRIKGVKRITRK